MKIFSTSIALLLLFSFSYFSAYSQATIEWENTLGGNSFDYAQATVPTADGGYLVGGYSQSDATGDKTEGSRGGSDYWVIKLDAAGNKVWDKTYGGDSFDLLVAITPAPDGGYLLGGFSSSGISGEKTAPVIGDSDFWIVKIDSDGNKLWDRTYGGSDHEALQALQATPDGGYLLVGNSSSNASGDKSQGSKGGLDFWLVKTDAQGLKIWDKTIGGNASDYPRAVTPAEDGGYILGGLSASNISGDKSESSRGIFDYWMVKINDEGTILWDRTYGGNDSDGLHSVINTDGGGYLLTGQSLSNASGDKNEDSNGNFDGWIIKTDAAGNMEWQNTIGGSGSDFLNVATRAAGGGYLIAGSAQSDESGDKSADSKGASDYWLIKTDATGNILWDKTIGGSHTDEVVAITAKMAGEYLLTGTSWSDASGDKSEDTNGTNDFWLVEVSEDGVNPQPIPTSGRISGGGWFYSPANAVVANPGLEGKARISFSVKQAENEDQPEGFVIFRLSEADLHFSATGFDWMHVQENRAIVEGSGEMNREEGYRFILSVADKGISFPMPKDNVRMIIWDPNGQLVYDNQRGTALYAEASFAIEAGAVYIHEESSESGIAKEEVPTEERQFLMKGLKAYPLPLNQEGLWLELPVNEQTTGEWQFSIIDMQGKIRAEKQYQKQGDATKLRWQLESYGWPAGVYMLEIKEGSKTYRQKLIK